MSAGQLNPADLPHPDDHRRAAAVALATRLNRTEAELEERLEAAAAREVAPGCPGTCPRKAPVTWSEWGGGRIIVHTCPEVTK